MTIGTFFFVNGKTYLLFVAINYVKGITSNLVPQSLPYVVAFYSHPWSFFLPFCIVSTSLHCVMMIDWHLCLFSHLQNFQNPKKQKRRNWNKKKHEFNMLRHNSIRKQVNSLYSICKFKKVTFSAKLSRCVHQHSENQNLENQTPEEKQQEKWDHKNREIHEAMRTPRWKYLFVAIVAVLVSFAAPKYELHTVYSHDFDYYKDMFVVFQFFLFRFRTSLFI